MSLAALIEDGTLSTLWKSGIRWLVIGQVFDDGLRLTDPLLESMARCETDGVFEVVKREAVPESRLAYLMRDDRPFCVDDRRLRKPEHEALRSSAGVGTGTFWVRCDRLAALFGITPEMLEGEWDAAEWTGKIGENLQSDHRLLLWGDRGPRFRGSSLGGPVEAQPDRAGGGGGRGIRAARSVVNSRPALVRWSSSGLRSTEQNCSTTGCCCATGAPRAPSLRWSSAMDFSD